MLLKRIDCDALRPNDAADAEADLMRLIGGLSQLTRRPHSPPLPSGRAQSG